MELARMNITISKELKLRVEEMSRKYGVSQSNFVGMALGQFVFAHDELPKNLLGRLMEEAVSRGMFDGKK